MSTGGDRRPLPAEVDLVAYRIVQESLTNVTRHAHATAVDVRTEQGPRHVTVEVTDNGRGPAPVGAGSGSGIAGMRERAWAATPGGSRPRSPDGCRG
ncbi:sensor histidine kinase [Streptomyces thinghirensis]|uniref:sensor histidine kinase n=1 Tax=Streptomyces thinghirensis TaxID=551547 RepID=UPI0031E5D9AA